VTSTINRDAGDKSKGPRLQRFRALELLFNAHQKEHVSHVYVATECEADVSIHVASKSDSSAYLEENKNYDQAIAFTFASKQILNTLVSFLDSWIALECDNEVKFGFHCPNESGKEKSTARTKKLKINWPPEPVLDVLANRKTGDDLDANLVEHMANLVKDEYSNQYAKKDVDGYQSVITKWTANEWKTFFEQIEWRLGQSDDAAAKNEVLDLIQKSKYYLQQHEGKEELIAAAATELLEERQGMQKAKDRFVHSSDIENIFLKIASSENVRLPDQAWQSWEQLPDPIDTRNIKVKVEAVTAKPPKRQIGKWSVKAASGFITQQAYGTDKSMLSFKFRIYIECSDRWDDFLDKHKGTTLSHQAINDWVTTVASHCCESIESLKSDHSYPVSNPTFIEEMVWVLIDECYLAFDLEPAV